MFSHSFTVSVIAFAVLVSATALPVDEVGIWWYRVSGHLQLICDISRLHQLPLSVNARTVSQLAATSSFKQLSPADWLASIAPRAVLTVLSQAKSRPAAPT
jgi:hypothetical protein